MRIKNLSLSWFRGAGDIFELDFNGKSTVIYGANGSGKSTLVDALEYILNNGRIRHLSHEYSKTPHNNAVRNVLAPRETPAKITLQLDKGKYVTVTIPEKGIPTFSGNAVADIQAWDARRVLLRQDEIAEFVRLPKGEKYANFLPLLGLENLEQAFNNLRAIEQHLTALTQFDQKRAVIKSLEQKLQQFQGKSHLEIIEELTRDMCSVIPVNREAIPQNLSEAIQALQKTLEAQIVQLRPAERQHIHLSQLYKISLSTHLNALKAARDALTETALDHLEEHIVILEKTSEILSSQPSSGTISCPACGREISTQELEMHVSRELHRLTEARELRKRLNKAANEVAASLRDISAKLDERDLSAWYGQNPDVKEAITLLSCFIDKDPTRFSQSEIQKIDSAWSFCLSRIGPYVATAPPNLREIFSLKEKLDLASQVPALDNIREYVSKTEIIKKALADAQVRLRESITERASEVIRDVSIEVRRYWSKLHPGEPIEDITLHSDDKSIDIHVKFYGVTLPSPLLTLSEGYRNSLGLCIFLAMASRDRDDTPIILDDVVTSQDLEHRSKIAGLINDEFSHRQVILLTHDRNWYTDLCQLLKGSWNKGKLRPWRDPRIGIVWDSPLAKSDEVFQECRDMLDYQPETAAWKARAILEVRLAIVAEELEVPMPFMRGDRNDRRTAIEFIDRISHRLKEGAMESRTESATYTPVNGLRELWGETKKRLIMWANRATHGNEVTRGEAEELIVYCEKLLSSLYCEECNEPVWLSKIEVKNECYASCGCQKIRWRL